MTVLEGLVWLAVFTVITIVLAIVMLRDQAKVAAHWSPEHRLVITDPETGLTRNIQGYVSKSGEFQLSEDLYDSVAPGRDASSTLFGAFLGGGALTFVLYCLVLAPRRVIAVSKDDRARRKHFRDYPVRSKANR